MKALASCIHASMRHAEMDISQLARLCLLLFLLCMSNTMVMAVDNFAAQNHSQKASYETSEVSMPAVVIITHPNNKMLSVADVKRFYSLNKRLLPNGESAFLTMMPPTAQESVDTFRFLIGLYPYQMQRIWDRAAFSGKGVAPEIYQKSSALIAFIAANKGAIGYVSVSSQVELNTLREVVHVIAFVK